MSKAIYSYDSDGNFIKGYPTIASAAADVGCDESSIRKSVGVGRSAGRFWSYSRLENVFFKGDDEILKLIRSADTSPSNLKNIKIWQTASGETRYSLNLGKNVPEEKLDEQAMTQELVREKKSNQRNKDKLNVLNKYNRQYARVQNVLLELTEKLTEQISYISADLKTYSHPETPSSVAVVQLSDTHFNELVDIPGNRYDFCVASQRLQKYASEVKRYCKVFNINRIIVAMTGDMLNSDRRLDEILAMATNRAKASALASSLISKFIVDLNQVANVDVVYVTGNESRIKDESGYVDLIASDNYDTIVFNTIRLLLRDKEGIGFIDTKDHLEVVININGANFLLLHGTNIGKHTQASIQQIIGKYALKDVLIDYIIFGHIHYANVTDLYTRSGSLVGSNGYSDKGVSLMTKPSQAIHIVTEDKEIHNIRVELSNVKGYQGYDIKDDIEAYNPRMADNLQSSELAVKDVS